MFSIVFSCSFERSEPIDCHMSFSAMKTLIDSNISQSTPYCAFVVEYSNTTKITRAFLVFSQEHRPAIQAVASALAACPLNVSSQQLHAFEIDDDTYQIAIPSSFYPQEHTMCNGTHSASVVLAYDNG